MKRVLILFLFAILLTSFASADIILNKQPKEIYNLGDIIEVPATIKTTNSIQGSLQMDLICNGPSINFYKNGVKLIAGEEKKFDSSIVLTKDIIGTIKGKCKIKAALLGEFVLTNEFRISDQLKVYVQMDSKEFNPGTKIFIDGSAVKENGEDVEGIIEVEFSSVKVGNTNESSNKTETVTMVLTDSVSNGFFSIEVDLAEDMAAGIHPMKLKVYEKDVNGVITNQGFTDSSIRILQLPTNLEIVFENAQVEPGTNLNVKAILHDQTGEQIDTRAILTVKKSDGTIIEQTEKPTNEFLIIPIAYNEPPAKWKAVAVSNEFMTESSFNITEKRDIEMEIINNTLFITNKGNVLYNETVVVKIGNQTMNLNTTLKVDETKKYKLSAPEGEYEIEILADGEERITQNVLLTGKSIDVKESANSAFTLIRHPFVWIFIVAILGFVAFIIFKKGYKKSFFGYIPFKKSKGDVPFLPLKKNTVIHSKNKAELSLAIKGEKQNSSVVCLKIKNLKEIQSVKSNAEETLQKIADLAEDNKAVIYENQENFFFIFAPTKTKTFKSEKSAIDLAKKTKQILDEHNKMAKQKISFGISLNYGTIVGTQEPESFKFMSMGTLITTAKKIANISEGETFLSDKFRARLGAEIRTEKHKKGDLEIYTIKEIKDREEHKDFIKSFLNRLEGKN